MKSPRSKHRIVVVEDDRTSRKILASIIENAGYNVIECAEAKDALHIVEMWPPEAMVIDVMLPDMQGTELVEELSQNPEFRFTQCIFLTGILSKKDANNDYFFDVKGVPHRALSKPVKKNHLLQLLAIAVKASISKREKFEREQIEADAEKNATRSIRAIPQEKEEEDEPIISTSNSLFL